jgi:pimeloyl-ACP methyl ester carboxylesterase
VADTNAAASRMKCEGAHEKAPYATHVTGMVIKNSGHWIYEEHPAQMTQSLLNFLQ